MRVSGVREIDFARPLYEASVKRLLKIAKKGQYELILMGIYDISAITPGMIYKESFKQTYHNDLTLENNHPGRTADKK